MKGLFITIAAIFILICDNSLAGDYHTPYAKDYNLYFNGASSNYANFAQEPSLGYSNTTITIEAWINTSNTAYTFQEIFSNNLDGNYNTSYNNLQFRTDINGYLEFGMNTGTWQSVKTTQQVTTGKWVHVAVVKNGTGTNNVTLYINGIASGTGTVSQDFTPDQMFVGAYLQNGAIVANTYFNGNIDEVRIWNIARTQNAIESDMYKELAGTEAGLIAYYKMNEGSGTTLSDASSNDYTLNLSGSDWQWKIFSSGAGTEESPYLIANLRDLQILSHNVSVWGSYFKQTADIDASATSNWYYGSDVYSVSEGLLTIGRFYNTGTSDEPYFTGTYDGQNFVISNIYIERYNDYYTGLFGITKVATIKNLGVVDCDVRGMNTVGGLVGKAAESTHISNAYVTGNVTTSNYNVGGFIGYNGDSESDNGCTVYNSYTNATVVGTETCGGLIGVNYGSLKNVYALGTVQGIRSGGLISRNTGTVVDSYASGTISGNEAGGFIYSNTGIVKYCYSLVEVNSSSAGGFMYSSNTSLTSNYWRQDAGSFNSGLFDLLNTNVGNITPASNVNMKVHGTYSGWNFIREWGVDGSTNNGYPFIKPLPTDPTNNGSSYLISSMSDLYWLSQRTDVWGENFILTANIDASETSSYTIEGFEPIGNDFALIPAYFTGSFNGQNYTISNIYINRPNNDYIGLFGRVDGASLENIHIVACNIIGNQYVGALAGRNTSNLIVNNVSSSGTVEGIGTNYSGGLIGYNSNSDITNSFSTATVVGMQSVGGLLGENIQSVISESFAKGNVNGTVNVGGLIGFNSTSSNISKSYATGNVNGTSPVGGLIGYNTLNSDISLSYASGSVSGVAYTGGFIGQNYVVNAIDACDISNCFATGNTHATTSWVGGFIGYNSYGTISYTYSTGEVTGNVNYTGGFIGRLTNVGTFISNFWRQDPETFNSGLNDIKSNGDLANITATTTANMKIYSTFTNAGWDQSKWSINSGINDGYPYLSSNYSFIIYVKSDAVGSNNGLNWANAYTSLQAALNAATSGKQIWVAGGTYKPSSAYDLTNSSRYYHFRMQAEVGIYGGFAGTETSINDRTNFGVGGANETILSGDLNGDDIVTGGGAALNISNNSENCYHVIYNPGTLTNASILKGFTIKGGNANGTDPHDKGSGIFNATASPSITCVTFTANGGKYGGGIYNLNSSPIVTNCLVYGNKTQNGGGIENKTSSPTFNNTTIAMNVATGFGGGMNNYLNSNPTFNNCIIWGNNAATGDQVYASAEGTTTLNYSCYSNQSGDVVMSSATFSAVNNNITSDPLFLNAVNLDFRITGNSLCTDAGSNDYNSESYDLRGFGFSRRLDKTTGLVGTIDMGAYEYKVGSEPLPVELTSFTANINANKVELNWQTATEVNNYGFEIERSVISGQLSDWESVGFVNGHGNSNSVKEYYFTDKPNGGTKFKYRLKQIDNDGKYEYSKEIEVDLGIPQEFLLAQNYPNPFNPTTTIKYSVPAVETGHAQSLHLITLKVYDILGNEVATLVNENKSAGNYEVKFNARNLSSGVYIYRIQTSSGFVSTKKLVLLK